MANYKNNKSPFKIITVVVLSLITGICLILDGWFVYLHFFGKEKITSTTLTVSDMTVSKVDTVSGETVTETKCFIELNLYDNCMEIKFNELYDERQQAFYSYGIQLMVKDGLEKTFLSDDISDGNFNKEIYSECTEKDVEVSSQWTTWVTEEFEYESYYNKVFSDKRYNYLDLYEYQSFDDYETPLQSTRLQDGEEFFKIQTQNNGVNEVYALSFINFDTDKKLALTGSGKKLITDNLTEIGSERKWISYEGFWKIKKYYDVLNYYRALDIYYFLDSMMDSFKGLAPGFIGETYLKMPDLFKLWKYNEDKSDYDPIGGIDDAAVNLSALNLVFSKIKLTVHEGNLTKSSQSMFNKYREIQNYDSDPSETDMTNYLTGRSLITATLDDLTWTATGESGCYLFSLSNEFKTRWKDYKKTAYIKVLIDSDFLNENNLTYSGFNLDSDFFIYEVETTNGEILYRGVENA